MKVTATLNSYPSLPVPKFILSGDWKMNIDKGKLTDFRANFYTGPVNGAENHTH